MDISCFSLPSMCLKATGPLSAGHGQVPQSGCHVARTPLSVLTGRDLREDLALCVYLSRTTWSPSSLIEGALWESKGTPCFSHLRLRLWDASGRLTGDSSSEMPQGSWGCLQGDSSLSLPALQGGTTHSLFLMSLQLTPLRSKSLLLSAEVPQAQSTPGLLVCFQIKFPISHFSVTLKK